MLTEALSRTLLLMRSDLRAGVADAELLAALTSVRVVIDAASDVTATHSGQSALITAALLMARSGHEVWIDAPEAELLAPQPPLRLTTLLAGLSDIGEDLLPDRHIYIGRPSREPDAIFIFGTGSQSQHGSELCFRLNADSWSASLAAEGARWAGAAWPIGGMAAGVLASGEAFKIAMRRLRDHARSAEFFGDLYAPCEHATLALAPKDQPVVTDLPEFDFVSGGAIANAALYVLHRLPGINGHGRVLDDDRSALSNLNRNALLTRSALDRFKVEDLARFNTGLVIDPVPTRFTGQMALADAVLVGVDHIPSRWAAQRTMPAWLGVGATEGFAVMMSSHEPDQPCVGCLHPNDSESDGGPIPTAAFVSFWSGLLLVSRWLRHLSGSPAPTERQQQFFTALRPKGLSDSMMPVPANGYCPVGCAASSGV